MPDYVITPQTFEYIMQAFFITSKVSTLIVGINIVPTFEVLTLIVET